MVTNNQLRRELARLNKVKAKQMKVENVIQERSELKRQIRAVKYRKLAIYLAMTKKAVNNFTSSSSVQNIKKKLGQAGKNYYQNAEKVQFKNKVPSFM